MRKLGDFSNKLLIFSIFAILFLSAFAIAQQNTTNVTSPQVTQEPVVIEQNKTKLDKGYQCLENKTRGKCSQLSIQEIALTILAVPASDVLSDCKTALTGKKDAKGCWPSGNCNVKDTAMAILALDRLGENTEPGQNWLLTQNKTATDIIWYAEQDSKDAAACTFSYDSNVYAVNVRDDKKIDAAAGPCLSLAQSNFWLQISPSCYNKDFVVSCDKDFLMTLLYRQSGSNTIFVLSDADTKPAYGSISIKVRSQCFGTSTGCDYESSAWATLALLETENNVADFIPYVLATGDSNARFLPNAFTYLITNYDDYATKLIQQQQLGNYWLADGSAYDKFYDSALALVSLRESTAIQVSKAEQWLEFSQQTDGCWQNIRDTAIVLWALTDRNPTPELAPTTKYCEQNDFFCLPKGGCEIGRVEDSYFCSSINTECCSDENLKTCIEYEGTVCGEGEVCSGQARKSLDENSCCLTSCEPEVTTPECENEGYGFCRDSCRDTEDIVARECNAGNICCAQKTDTGSSWWIWLLILLILIVAGAILGVIYKDQIKLWWLHLQEKMKKSKGKGDTGQQGPGGRPGYPPRPGIPPAPGIMQRPMQPRPGIPPQQFRPGTIPPRMPPRR